MCLQRPQDLTDNLGYRLESPAYVDEDHDTCDYIDLTEDQIWTCTKNDLSVLQINIRGLLNKQNDLLNLANRLTGKTKLDIMILQETWLTQSNKHLVNILGYRHYMQHHTGKKGGGVSLLISNELTSQKCENLCHNESYLECCTIEVKLPLLKLIVSSVYRPSNTDSNSFNRLFDKLLNSICKKSNNSLIGLDHNLDLLKSHSHKPTHSFLENTLDNAHVPIITRPTRITKSSATLIDNLPVSRDIYNNVCCGIAISNLSDHFPCIMTRPNLIKIRKENISFDIRNWTRNIYLILRPN